MQRVIGTIGEADPGWFGALPPIKRRYGVAHGRDYEGFGRQSDAGF